MAAEHLTFVPAGGSGGAEAVYVDESILLTQKITDIYATALDYYPTTTATKRFFAAGKD